MNIGTFICRFALYKDLQRLLLATTNSGKVLEYKALLGELPIQLVSLKDAGITMAAEEDGKTFEENSVKKAMTYHSLTGLPVLADDGGIEIDYLNGEPGVLSRRWPGYEAEDEELISMTLEKLKGAPKKKRTARLVVCITLLSPGDSTLYIAEAAKEGIIGIKPVNYKEGYPFRALFYLPDMKKYYSELSDEDEIRVGHRKKAIETLLPIIRKKLL